MIKRKCWRCQNDLDSASRLCPVCGAYNRLTVKTEEKWVIVCHKCRRAIEPVDGKMPRLCSCGSFLNESRDEKMKWEDYLELQGQDSAKRNQAQSVQISQPEGLPGTKRSTVISDSIHELVLQCGNERKRITLKTGSDSEAFPLGRGGIVDQEFFAKCVSDIPIEIKYEYVGWYLKANSDNEVQVIKADDGRIRKLRKGDDLRLSDNDHIFIGNRLIFDVQIGQGA